MRARNTTKPGAPRRARRAARAVVPALISATVLAFGLERVHTAGSTLLGAGSSSEPAGLDVSRGARRAADAFRIGGSVHGLYPGATKPLVLTVTNPQPYAVVVTSLATAVASASPGCHAGNLTVGSFSGRLVVPRHGSAQTTVPATLAHAAPNACQGADFPLLYSGLGHRA